MNIEIYGVEFDKDEAVSMLDTVRSSGFNSFLRIVAESKKDALTRAVSPMDKKLSLEMNAIEKEMNLTIAQNCDWIASLPSQIEEVLLQAEIIKK